jgi:hypothetical protein
MFSLSTAGPVENRSGRRQPKADARVVNPTAALPPVKPVQWYYHAHTVPPVFDWRTAQSLKRNFPLGGIRVGYGDYAIHLDQRRNTHRLPSREWPSIAGKALWPSSPNICEMLSAGKTGWVKYPEVHANPVARSSMREFSENAELAKRVILRQVVGVRSDVPIPKRYLGYFRYRWGFLILTAPGIPIGLARKLASLWVTDPYSLWLERKVTLKKFLREVPVAILNCARATFVRSELCSVNETGTDRSLSVVSSDMSSSELD